MLTALQKHCVYILLNDVTTVDLTLDDLTTDLVLARDLDKTSNLSIQSFKSSTGQTLPLFTMTVETFTIAFGELDNVSRDRHVNANLQTQLLQNTIDRKTASFDDVTDHLDLGVLIPLL